MVTAHYGWGNRLGNTMLMYTAAYVFAKKHKLSFKLDPLMPHFSLSPDKPELVTTGFNEPGSTFKTKPLPEGSCYPEPCVPIDNINFLPLLAVDELPPAHYHFVDYFQLKDFALNYYNEIRDVFDITYQPRPDHEIFVIFRLGDVAKRRQRLPVEFYIEAIEKLQQKGCYGGYITSDSPDHPEVKLLQERFNLKLFVSNVPTETLNFGKDFNNLVLSEGTFCWWVGVLSNAKNVYYNNRRDTFTWHGDIFVYPHWESLSYDLPGLPVDPC